MNRNELVIWLGVAHLVLSPVALGQIPYVTARTPRSPGPPMTLVRTNGPPPAAQPAAQTVRALPQPPPPTKPSLAKAELERNVVSFQTKRAIEGSPSAQYELGMRYSRGDGVVKDIPTARTWLKLAAQGGNKQARDALDRLEGDPHQNGASTAERSGEERQSRK